ncbi:MAG: S8 family serine peptidase [Clostridiales bacterium]|jgi:subtilisin family serine protease|nr:S8 family serine peptidase [Clostridiales bacterium]
MKKRINLRTSSALLSLILTLSPIAVFSAEIPAVAEDSSIFLSQAAGLAKSGWSDDYVGKITLAVDDPYMYVDGVKKEIDPGQGTSAIISQDRVLVPARAIMEEVGVYVQYTSADRRVLMQDLEFTVYMQIDSDIIYANGVRLLSDVPPTIENGRTMIPLRVLAENFGFEVGWDPSSKVISLTREFQTKRLLVKAEDDKVFSMVEPLNGKVLKGPGNLYVLQFPTLIETKRAYEELIKDELVSFIEPDRYIANGAKALESPPTSPWGAARIGADRYAGDLVKAGNKNSVIVAVVDTGIDYSHPSLKGRIASGGYDYINNDDNPADDNFHGTHVSGIISDSTSGATGIKVLPIKALNADGAGTSLTLGLGIIHAVSCKASIINLSVSGPDSSDFINECIAQAIEKGVAVIVSAGDEAGDSALNCLANISEATVVAAVDQNDEAAGFSNYGTEIDISAPGSSIGSSMPGGGFASFSGTSFAAAFVSAAAAMFKANDPSLTPKKLESAIRASADDKGLLGWDNRYGEGILNMVKVFAYSVEVKSVKDLLYASVEKYDPNIYLSKISILGNEIYPILVAGSETENFPVAVAGAYGNGKFIAMANDSNFKAELDHSASNNRFRLNLLDWLLTGSKYNNVGLPDNHGEALTVGNFSPAVKALVEKKDYEVVPLRILGTMMANAGVVVLGDPSISFSEREISALISYVRNGGSLLLLGNGWYWAQRYEDPECASMPLNAIGAVLGFKFEGEVIRDIASVRLAK